MAKPVIMAVDDEPEVLGAIERDLRRKYGTDYQVLRAGWRGQSPSTPRPSAPSSRPTPTPTRPSAPSTRSSSTTT